jgi:hypothetical protein
MSGIPVSYSPRTVGQWPKNLSSHLMYGNWWGFPVPDIERTDLLVVATDFVVAYCGYFRSP